MTTSMPLCIAPTRPYMFQAMLDWILDNALTPLVIVDATYAGVIVPMEYVQDGQIVLNIAPHTTNQFVRTLDGLSFSARFNKVSHDLYVPMASILSIYTRETQQGMNFDPEEYAEYEREQAERMGTNVAEEKEKPTVADIAKKGFRVL